MSMQCKDIPDRPILQFLRDLPPWPGGDKPRWGSLLVNNDGQLFDNSVQHAMPAGTPWKLAKAKMGTLINRGLVSGCDCGCRGDFELTEKGAAVVGQA